MRTLISFSIIILTTNLNAQNIDGDTISVLGLRKSDVSMAQVLANPSFYDGFIISVTGYFHWRFEDGAIYFSKNDADYLIFANAFWVTFSKDAKLYPIVLMGEKEPKVDLDYFDGKYVKVNGTFNAKKYGHFGSFAGTIENIEWISELRQWYDGKDNLWEDKIDGRGLRPIKKNKK